MRKFYFHMLVEKDSLMAILALLMYRMLRRETDYDESRRWGDVRLPNWEG